ncbi:PspC domain-containing protein [Tessaracoccus sp. HDW20]|uniref:PspC domain-containing protein n=1 Tax=Tessaracoccus coleopterorum TaxID=2714950 RepID=UPI0018D41A19|nr:PspC domain-containing protein [Tessaracoccus coleopterorum]NHB85601.1 PspC domain-containing protein [Tessaracoccus coleopterorum]
MASALARHLGISVGLVRMAFVISALFSGSGRSHTAPCGCWCRGTWGSRLRPRPRERPPQGHAPCAHLPGAPRRRVLVSGGLLVVGLLWLFVSGGPSRRDSSGPS